MTLAYIGIPINSKPSFIFKYSLHFKEMDQITAEKITSLIHNTNVFILRISFLQIIWPDNNRSDQCPTAINLYLICLKVSKYLVLDTPTIICLINYKYVYVYRIVTSITHSLIDVLQYVCQKCDNLYNFCTLTLFYP